MNLEELISKAVAAAKDGLSDEEKKALSEFKSDAIAAAARKDEAAKRKVEKDRADALQAKLDEAQAKIDEADNAGKSAAEKEKAALEKTLSKLKAAEDRAAKAEAEFSEHRRNSAVDRLFSSLKLVDGLDPDLIRPAFAAKFKDLDEAGLKDESQTKAILDGFRASSKAILADTSGHGGGSREKGSGSTSKSTVKRSDFDGMKATQQDAFIKSGGKVEN